MTAAQADAPRLWSDEASPGVSNMPLRAALIASAALHLLLILGLSFEPPKSPDGAPGTPSLEVVVLRNPKLADEKPDKAEALAQASQRGSGAAQGERPADTPRAQDSEEPPEPALQEEAAPPVPPPEPMNVSSLPDESTLTATLDAAPDAAMPAPAQATPPQRTVSAGDILASRYAEIAKLTARIEQSSAAYANRPRRKAVSASTREYKYATYLEAWRRKVERIGNLNYPDEAKRRRLYGSLILQVAVRADGSLQDVRVVRSSGFDVLDKAAVRIVRLAAPFAPFPPDIRAETDILDITRTWQFLSNNRLGWEK